jgi:hypothetical protein
VQRLGTHPAGVGSKLAHPFQETGYALPDGWINVEGNEETHNLNR